MERWARWQVYLFWVSLAVAAIAVSSAAAVGASEGRWHHLALLAPALVAIPFSGLMYRRRVSSVAELRAREARLRLLIEEASDPIFISDAATARLIAANRRATVLTGYGRDELLRMKISDLVDLSDEEVSRHNESLAGGDVLRLEQILLARGGRRIPIEVSLALVGDERIQAIVRSIDERKAVEESLKRSEEVFRAVSEMTSDYAFSMHIGPEGTLVPEWFTAGFERVTGFTVEEFEQRGGWRNLVHPDDLPRMAGSLAASLKGLGSARQIEFRIITSSGEIRHLQAWFRYERDDEDGPIVRVAGAASDITERKRLELNLRESERRFRRLYERLPIGLYRRALGGSGLEANPTVIEMFGYPDEKTYIEQDPVNYYVDPADRDRWLSTLLQDGVVRNFEVRYKRYDGTPFWARNTARLVRDANGNEVIEGAIIDIAEEKELDEEHQATLRDLRRSDAERRRLLTHLVKAKEEERNRVASDIHDDSVQLMTAVAIDLERLSRKAPDEELRSSLERLENRVRDAVGRLRKMVFELRPPALDEDGVASALRLYLEEFSIDTGIEYELKNNLETEPVNPMRVVLYRIAQEALTNVRKHSGASRVTVSLDRVGDGVSMTLTDDGSGFDVTSPDLASPGHIGLAEMRERAEMSGGRLGIQSVRGTGTTVTVWVPEFSR